MIKTIQLIEVYDWDNLVQKTYGRPYSFQQQDGCKERGTVYLSVPSSEKEAATYDYDNDSIPEVVNGKVMGVSFKAWLERNPKQKLDSPDKWVSDNGISLFWERNFYPAVEMIAYDLFKKGLLPAGKYLINIDW